MFEEPLVSWLARHGKEELAGTFIFIKGLGLYEIETKREWSDGTTVKLQLKGLGERIITYWTRAIWRETKEGIEECARNRGWWDV